MLTQKSHPALVAGFLLKSILAMRALTSGIIYQRGDPQKGSVSFVKKGFRFVPQAFFLGGLLGTLIIFSPLMYTEANYRLSTFKKEKVVIANSQIQKENFSKLVGKNDIKILQPVDPEFSLLIPKIGVNSLVFPNVSPTDESQYKRALKAGVAHAAGTYLPGENGRIFLFGHSTDYIWNVPQFNAIFYLLRELNEGDEIDIFYQGKRYLYQVIDKKIVDPSEVLYLKPKWGQEEIILQTCHPPGTTWQRLLVIAQPKTQNLTQN